MRLIGRDVVRFAQQMVRGAFRLVPATLAVRRVCRIRRFGEGGVSCRYHHGA